MQHHPAWRVWHWVIDRGPHRLLCASQHYPFSDITLVQWALCSSYHMTLSGLIWSECVGTSGMTKALMPMTGPHIPQRWVQLRTSGTLCIAVSDTARLCQRMSRSPLMLWSSRTPSILSSAESPYVGRSYIKTLGRYALLSHIMTQIGSACLVDQLSCFYIWEFYVFSSYKMTVHMDGHWHQAS